MPLVKLSNGQSDYYEVDDYTDPWNRDESDIVIFQPGILRHTDFTFHLVPLMCRHVRFIRRDLRGHGRSWTSDVPGYHYTLDTLVDEMAEFIDKVAGRPVHWIGESTAGMVSIALAAKYPSKLKSLIVMSSPLVLNDAFKTMVSRPYSSQAEAMRKMGLVEWQRSRPVSKLSADPNARSTNEMGTFSGPGYLKWYDEMLAKHNLEGVASYCHFIANVDVTSHVENIIVPTLILAPRNSMASPISVNQEMAAKIKGSCLVIIDSVGHMLYIDEPEKTCDAILKWVRDLRK
ncbi:Alpha/Beta hydrolase protein [Ilyonectria robusta]|uniref:Alpha/Beta hydrolase protein n=1 Tax=Ilyonectria robusta TaxID=1079257 RepID=UPI001E8D1508|nr:Alpha/Beta hydrolase protein [Ilyonectria robusta]KAH8652978.1 Alpha/Beta hydrolase protein [Ilyonectria robusta]